MSNLGWLTPLLIGWTVLYGQIYLHLWNTIWQAEEYGFAPLIGFVSGALFYLKSKRAQLPIAPSYATASILFTIGLILAITGYAFNIPFIALLSQPLTLAGIVLFIQGKAALKLYSFPILFLLFMVPVPGFLLESLTYVLKEHLSTLTVSLLYWLGYPIASSGVIIQIGHYQLLVADACSGLHSLISLSALGLVYLHLYKTNRLLNFIMLSLVVPVALLGNFIRILLITLITYHFGDITGNMLHDYMGVILFLFTGGLLVIIQHSLNYFIQIKGISV